MTKKPKLYVITLSVIALITAGIVVGKSRFNLQSDSSATQYEARMEFPEVDVRQLSPVQQKLVATLRQEYDSQPQGTKYSEGASEPWCADFVSWVYKEVGHPFVNPHSGSWRIPGTVTLRDYYQSIGRFKAAGSAYVPKVGDIMFYTDPSPFGHHTNIVVKNERGVITTVGGNEQGEIRVVEHTPEYAVGFIGYGVFE